MRGLAKVSPDRVELGLFQTRVIGMFRRIDVYLVSLVSLSFLIEL